MENSDTNSTQEIRISLHPNPATDCTQASGFTGSAKIIISNFHCRVLLSKDIVDEELVCLKSLPKGVYIAKIISENGTERRKLVKN